ncbi:MAG: hypothetical protein AAGA55_09450, partial [Planctomycetota bacterium]
YTFLDTIEFRNLSSLEINFTLSRNNQIEEAGYQYTANSGFFSADLTGVTADFFGNIGVVPAPGAMLLIPVLGIVTHRRRR